MRIRQGQPARRSAAVTLEFILALPILFLVTLAVFQFGFLMVAQQTVTEAAAEGARAAAKEANAADAQTAALAAVNNVLAAHGQTISAGSTDLALVVEYGFAMPATVGMLSCSTPMSPALAGNETRVTVCYELTAAPLLNALALFGLDVTGDKLEISAMAGVE